jgi:death-on-curing protein
MILHADILGASYDTAEHYLQSRDRLESALARPLNSAHYEGADLIRQAATLLWGMIESHPFLDGNKRVGWVTTRTFLRLNGWNISGTVFEQFDLIVGIADRRYDLTFVTQWLRERTRPNEEP